MTNLLLFGNVSQPPYCNNLLPPLRAFQKAFRTTLVEPFRDPGFVQTGGWTPAPIPDDLAREALRSEPDVVVCLAGGLGFSEEVRRSIPERTVLAGFAISDPYGFDASVAIAPQFDLFYTHHPESVPDYRERGIDVRLCDAATDPELYHPLEREPECDVLYYGKWTPYRQELVSSIAARFRVHVHAYPGESRWAEPTRPPLDTPEALCEALNRSRLALESALMNDVAGRHRDTYCLKNRPQFAAACGVPTLIERFEGLRRFFEPGVEIAVFGSFGEAVAEAGRLLGDDAARRDMGRRARERVLREQTWDQRIEAFQLDVREWKSRAHAGGESV